MENTQSLWGIWFLLSAAEGVPYYYLLFSIMNDGKYLKKRDFILMWGSGAGMSVVLAFNLSMRFFSWVVFLAMLMVLVVWSCLVMRKRLLLILGITLTYYSFTALLDFSFAFLQAAVVQSDISAVASYAGLDVGRLLIYACIGSRIVMIIMSIIICKSNVRRDIEEFRGVLLTIGIMLSVLALEYQRLLEHGIYFSTIQMGVVKDTIRGSMITLITTVAMAGVLGILLLKNKSIKKENYFLMVKEKMERQKYEELYAAIEMNRELVHDTKNHYLVISEYEQSGEYDKLHQYVEGIRTDFIKINPQIYTGNKVLDLVLGQKKMKAKQKKIAFELQTIPLTRLPFEEKEICALFGNLLDNAIEACEKIVAESRIQVKIEKQRQLIFIEIVNPIDKIPSKRENGFLTSKSNKEGHGYGLKSVRRIVEAYEGVISFDVKEKEFVVSVSFFDVG